MNSGLSDLHIEIARICLRFWCNYLYVAGQSCAAPVEAALTKLVFNKLKPGRAPSQADLRSEIPIEGIEEVLWTINAVTEFFFPAETPECLREAREAWFKLACYCKHSLLGFELDATKTEIRCTTSAILSDADVGEGGRAEKVERERAAVTNKKE